MGQRSTFAVGGGGTADSGSNGVNGGRFAYSGGNETERDSYDDDPALDRTGGTIRSTGGGGGGRCYDDLPTGPGGRRVQMFLEHVEQSEMVRGNPGSKQCALKWQMNHGGGEADSDMRTVFQLETRTGTSARPGHEHEVLEAFQLGEAQWESLVRQLAARRVAGGHTSRFWSDDGVFCFNVQGPASGQPDGKIIQYRTVDAHGHPILDESQWTAVATWSGTPL